MSDGTIYYVQTVLAFTLQDPYEKNAWRHIYENSVTSGYFENDGADLLLHDTTRLYFSTEAPDGRRVKLRSGSWGRRDEKWVFDEASPPSWLTITERLNYIELTYPRFVEAPPGPSGETGGYVIAPLMIEYFEEELRLYCKANGVVKRAKQMYVKQNGIIVPIKRIAGR